MPTIEKRASRGRTVYHVKVRLKGHPTQTATFPSLTDARKWAQITEADIITGRYLPNLKAKQYTLSELIDRYLSTVMPDKRHSTIIGQTRQLRWWRDQLGHHTLADITPAIIIEHRDKLTCSGSTVNRYMAILSHAFTVAVKEWQWVDDNPCRRIKKRREPKGRTRYLSDEERGRLLAECRSSRNSHLYILVVLALSTGARRGELLSLTWPQVDLKRGMILLDDTKNGESRSLPLTGRALEVMREHASCSSSGWVFPSKCGTKPADIRKGWENAVERAGLDDFTFHSLRHSAASYLAMNGASLAEIAEILGHRSLEMTRRYAHLNHEHTRKVLASLNEVMFG
jgi:integrase